MPFARINGLDIHYELHGEAGDPLVFVHGYSGHSAQWVHQIEAFADRYRILVFDNRGHGLSEAPADRSAYTVEHMVEDTVQLIDRVGFDRYHLVGHSMGGAVAQEVALAMPERLLSLTLQDTTHWFGDHEEPGGTLPYTPEEEMERAAERIERMPDDAVEGAWQGLLAWRGSTDRAHAIRVPTMIILGGRDASRIVEGSEKLLELIPNAHQVVIDGAGHSPQRAHSDEFNAALEGHLRRAGGHAGG